MARSMAGVTMRSPTLIKVPFCLEVLRQEREARSNARHADAKTLRKALAEVESAGGGRGHHTGTGEPTVRVEIFLERELVLALKTRAVRERRSLSALIREFLSDKGKANER